MAKGQKRSTRELKKPKANKKLVSPAALAGANQNKAIMESIALKKKG